MLVKLSRNLYSKKNAEILLVELINFINLITSGDATLLHLSIAKNKILLCPLNLNDFYILIANVRILPQMIFLTPFMVLFLVLLLEILSELILHTKLIISTKFHQPS